MRLSEALTAMADAMRKRIYRTPTNYEWFYGTPERVAASWDQHGMGDEHDADACFGIWLATRSLEDESTYEVPTEDLWLEFLGEPHVSIAAQSERLKDAQRGWRVARGLPPEGISARTQR